MKITLSFSILDEPSIMLVFHHSFTSNIFSQSSFNFETFHGYHGTMVFTTLGRPFSARVPQNQPHRVNFRVHLGVHEGPDGFLGSYDYTKISIFNPHWSFDGKMEFPSKEY